MSSRRVVVCVGAGGVGKTSVAAGLSVAAARAGRRVVVLTVDPARRLAEALGVDPDVGEAQYLRREQSDALEIPEGLLAVKMLDAGQVWDSTVTNLSSSPTAAARVLEHPLYQTLRHHLAGAQDYMAMEALLTLLRQEPAETLIVLDTPPSRHALDFLDGPERLGGALDTPLVRAFARSGQEASRFGLDWAARSAAALMSTMGRVTGKGFLQELATLIAALHQLFGGLGERAARVAEAFRDPSFAFVLVTRPSRAAIEDTRNFLTALSAKGMRAEAVLVNRCRLAEAALASPAAATTRELEGLLEPGLRATVRAALAHEAEQRTYEASCLSSLLDDARFTVPVCLLPPLHTGIGELSALSRLAELLATVAPVRRG